MEHAQAAAGEQRPGQARPHLIDEARIVELHYFGGLTHAEIATALEIHVNTVARDLRFAQAWLQRAMA
mgnify:CR=1 FL=1